MICVVVIGLSLSVLLVYFLARSKRRRAHKPGTISAIQTESIETGNSSSETWQAMWDKSSPQALCAQLEEDLGRKLDSHELRRVRESSHFQRQMLLLSQH